MSLASSAFAATRWTLVQRSRGSDTEAGRALSDLCAAYYEPVVAFLRRDGRSDDAARELAHAFFATLLAGGAIEGADPARGKFRNYLLGALKHFAAGQLDYAHAAKRGGGREFVSMEEDASETGARLQFLDPRAECPDHAFDRQWALTILSRALKTLEREMIEAGKGDHFAVLKPWLTGDSGGISQAEAAAALTSNENTVKVAIHRLRKRFRETVKTEICQTVVDPAQIQEEMDCLIAALR
jgi:RNA polymerase sigma-70 factor (ECF subfamily)